MDFLYELYANLGTVRVHDWFRRGAPDDDLASLEQAITEIEQAIKINPDAHFGREVVQLHVMRLLLLSKRGDFGGYDGPASKLHEQFLDYRGKAVDRRSHNKKLIDGAVGMIVMGGGWESPDMYAFLAGLLTQHEDSVLADLALKRENELLEAGRKQAFSRKMRQATGIVGLSPMIDDSREQEMRRYFSAVRENGDEHKANRDAFMLAKLEKGEHPDTHDDFWDGYEEVAKIDFEMVSKTAASESSPAWKIGLSIAIPAGFFALWYMTRRNSRKAA
ncbi:MAG: hypothetical protein IH945_13165 [Armatimonadetes bacterium]|nr:hypothetical protein [Armatimonadota bacterium]